MTKKLTIFIFVMFNFSNAHYSIYDIKYPHGSYIFIGYVSLFLISVCNEIKAYNIFHVSLFVNQL